MPLPRISGSSITFYTRRAKSTFLKAILGVLFIGYFRLNHHRVTLFGQQELASFSGDYFLSTLSFNQSPEEAHHLFVLSQLS
jgi:hypothetical protein